MLYIFDKDGTLVGGASNRPANAPEEQILLPGVAEKIAALKAAWHKIAIASNQGGVAWGFISLAQAEALVMDAAKKIGADDYLLCPHDDRKNHACECRKPRPGMLINLMEANGFSPAETILIGDQESDRQAADAAGCQFVWASEFFGG